jgi:sodium/bile acid cotransporter 7
MLKALLPDRFIAALLASVALAALLPCRGEWITVFSAATTAAIAVMFFLQGARLSRQAIVAGLIHWRLHLVILAATFVLFPLIGLGLRAVLPHAVSAPLWLGLLFVCLLPSTVQSSIAFTSIAGGNVAAAVVAATASNLIGILATPLLVGLLLSLHGGISLTEIRDIALQLLAPFLAGQLLQRWIGDWVRAHRSWTTVSDRLSILLVVYTAFSAAVVAGIWQMLSIRDLVAVGLLDALVLAIMMTFTVGAARALGFDRSDRITILFCGSKKSLATGVPMAKVLFAAKFVGLAVIPLMIFHQLQLMVCAAIARRYASEHHPIG